MSACVGIDLSSFAIDLVKLNESDNQAEWIRCELEGKDAWGRTLDIHNRLVGLGVSGRLHTLASFWDDVYLVAIEAPYGRGQAGTQAILNRVVGAVAASLPARLRTPERCWIVRPDEWRAGLGLTGKPTMAQFERVSGTYPPWRGDQNARDAYFLAMFARDLNAKGVAAA